jgi:hypothetical protein
MISITALFPADQEGEHIINEDRFAGIAVCRSRNMPNTRLLIHRLRALEMTGLSGKTSSTTIPSAFDSAFSVPTDKR